MLCPTCYGRRFIDFGLGVSPCKECAGMGEIHCCDGLAVQPGQPDEGCANYPSVPQPLIVPANGDR